jgi:translation elongation factor EF-Ts
MYTDFIAKNPEFKTLKDAMYEGKDVERKNIAKKLVLKFNNEDFDKYQSISEEFNKFIDDMLISVAGDGTINDK